jgi:hypothetical protein
MSSFHVVENTVIVSHGLALAGEQDKNHKKIKQSYENNVTAIKKIISNCKYFISETMQ